MAKQQSNKDSDKNKKQGNIRLNPATARAGLNLDSSINQVGPGRLTYALNAAVENFDSSSVNYQNEPGNELCLDFPTGYKLIGSHFIPEKRKNIFFLANPNTGDSEIGYMDNNDCQYHTLINAACLNFDVKNPIRKVVHRITNCTTELYWTDGVNPRRYLDIDTSLVSKTINGIDPASESSAGNPLLPPAGVSLSGPVWAENTTFKVRIVSKDTGRKIDFNLNFNVEGISNPNLQDN